MKTMSCVFASAAKFNQNVSSWKVQNVKNMRGMSMDSSSFNQDLNGWAVSADTNTCNMFYRTDSLEDKPYWYQN